MRTTTFLSLLPLLASTTLAVPHKPSLGKHVRRTGMMADNSSMGGGCGDSGCGGDMAAAAPPAMDSMAAAGGGCGDSGCGGGDMAAAPPPPAMDSMAGGGCGDSGCGGGMMAETMAMTTTMAAAPPPPMETAMASVTDMNSCMQMCQATFGGGMDSMMGMDSMAPPPPSGTASAAASGTTHNIVVAPTKGVLRFVPFAVTANPGDMLHFMWGAGPHTSTLSLGESPCNRSTTANAFDSGKLNATATFDTVFNGDVNTPQFHYCTVATHCVKGMFGLVNPPSTNVSVDAASSPPPTMTVTAAQAGSTAGSGSAGCQSNGMDCWIQRWMQSSPQAMATAKAVQTACKDTPAAWAWGANMDMSSVESPEISRQTLIENVMYSRLMFAMNPSMLTPGAPVPDNFTAAPDLNEFVAQNGGPNSTSTDSSAAGATGGAGAYGGGSPSGSAPSGGASGSTTAQSAQDANPSGGASARTNVMGGTALLGLTGVLVSVLL